MKLTEQGHPLSGEIYEDAAFDLTGLSLSGTSFIRCVLTLRPNGRLTLTDGLIEGCFLTGGGWPESYGGEMTMSEWAASISAGRA